MKIISFKVIITISILSLVFSSCSKKIPLYSKKLETPIFYPEAPARARFQYFTMINNSGDITPGSSVLTDYVVGKKGISMINQPFNTTIHNNKIYVVDQGAGLIEIFDLKEKTFNFFSPQGRGQTKGPINIAFDEKNYMYIADAKRKEVLIFNEKLIFVNSIRDTGNTRPVDVKIYDNKLYVADVKVNTIKVYSTEKGNKFLYNLVDKNAGEDENLAQPTSIAINQEYIYVLDGMLTRVQKYTHEGKYVSTIGGQGTNIGLFGRPKSITLDREGNLFVVDGAWVNTQIFNKEDKLLMWFGMKTTDPGGLYGPMGITVDYDNLDFFQPFVDPGYQLKYLVFICNQFGNNKINVYGAVDPINETTEPDIKDGVEPEKKEE
jgi:hypothetical protein